MNDHENWTQRGSLQNLVRPFAVLTVAVTFAWLMPGCGVLQQPDYAELPTVAESAPWQRTGGFSRPIPISAGSSTRRSRTPGWSGSRSMTT